MTGRREIARRERDVKSGKIQPGDREVEHATTTPKIIPDIYAQAI